MKISTIFKIILEFLGLKQPKTLQFVFLGIERPRSNKWRTIRKKHLIYEPFCKMCGGTKNLEVHHIRPFHLHGDKELDEKNLITLCERPGVDCHLKHGHLGDWKGYNPRIKDIAKAPSVGIPTHGYINSIYQNIIICFK